MDTQNTPVHLKLWHREFWMLALANLLLMMSAYGLLPTLPFYLLGRGLDGMQTGLVMGIYGAGLFALGGFCSYYVQRYRRNHVCQYSILGLVLCMGMAYYLEFVLGVEMEFRLLLLVRFAIGAFLRLAAMVLGSTLAIAMVRFPFKAPSEKMPLFSLDRFFLPQGLPLFVNLILIMMVVGVLLAQVHSVTYYAMLLAGLAMAIVAERFAFANAELKSEVLTGIIVLAAAVLMEFTHQARALDYMQPAMIGFASGIIGSRFLLFYLKLSKHCQRGTSQSSFFLAWETGISLGFLLKFGFLSSDSSRAPYACLGLLVISLGLYNFFVHPWYMKHRNR